MKILKKFKNYLIAFVLCVFGAFTFSNNEINATNYYGVEYNEGSSYCMSDKSSCVSITQGPNTGFVLTRYYTDYIYIYKINFGLSSNPTLVSSFSYNGYKVYNISTDSVSTYSSSGSYAVTYDNNNNAVINMGSNFVYYFVSNGYTEEDLENAYNEGYRVGENAGLTTGYNNGYSAGESAGLTTGYNNGYSAGLTTGYNNGYSAGYSAGESAGLIINSCNYYINGGTINSCNSNYFNSSKGYLYFDSLNDYVNDLYDTGYYIEFTFDSLSAGDYYVTHRDNLNLSFSLYMDNTIVADYDSVDFGVNSNSFNFFVPFSFNRIVIHNVNYDYAINGFGVLNEPSYNAGYDYGYFDGQEIGYNTGYNTGYNNGYTAGNEAKNNLVGLVGAIFTGPVTMLSAIFNFEFLGINLTGLILSLTTLLVVIWLIKRFI